jgi:hypothetical protein
MNYFYRNTNRCAGALKKPKEGFLSFITLAFSPRFHCKDLRHAKSWQTMKKWFAQ